MIESGSPLEAPPYVTDILAQPEALQALLDTGLSTDVRALLGDTERFDRLVLTGMGASLFAQVPTMIRLAAAGRAVWNIETAELLSDQGALIDSRTLLWITSQSGASAEVGALLERVQGSGATVLGSTNDMSGPLAQSADVVLELHAGAERTVSTRSYINTLAAHALAVDVILRAPPDPELLGAAVPMARWLEDWADHAAALDHAVRRPTLYVLGRGTSMAAVATGALIIKEAAKVAVEGMSAPQFRHGPLELADPDLVAVVLAGSEPEQAANSRTASDLRQLGATAVLLGGTSGDTDLPLPGLASPRSLPLAEILPLQALSVVLAERRGVEPGAFRQISKVTQTL